MKDLWSNKLALSLIAGMFLGLSFPPVGLAFLSIPAFVLFFRVTDISDNLKQAAYYSYPGLLLWNLITTYWLMLADVYAGIAANLANAVLMTIPLCLGAYLIKKSSYRWFGALLQASAWVAYEYLHHNWDLAWPWLAIGNAWSDMTGLIQYISITGHLGITFWVVLTASLLYQGITCRHRGMIYSALAVFLFLPAASLISYQTYGNGQADLSTNVVVVQPNHDSYENFSGMSGINEVMDSLYAETERHRTTDTDLIIWPENAIDKSIYSYGSEEQRISDSARAWKSPILTGTGYIDLYNEENTPQFYRERALNRPFNIYNAALFADTNGVVSYYFKGNLVPIVERFPFLKFFDAIDLFNWVEWGEIQGFGKGTDAKLFSGDQFITPGLVCYDSVYPGWIRPFILNGATFITIITNDGWWGDSSGHHQHFAYARLRAIEFDRWVVRSANNGISGIISPSGEIKIKTDYWIRTGFSYDVPNRTTLTFYARFGDWLPLSCLVLVFSSWILALIRNRFTASE